MSRFDDFAKSRAEGRGLFSALKRTRPSSELDGDAGVSRRDLMKKAGLVTGAAVVGSTLIQSATAPAYAASCTNPSDATAICGGTDLVNCARCPNGAQCNNAVDCASGVCTGNACVAASLANGGTCTGATQLQKDQSCTSGYCGSDGKCATPTGGVVGSPCHGGTQSSANANCASGTYCSGYTGLTGSGTCKVADGGTCIGGNTSERDASCASTKCTTGNPKICKKSTGAACATATASDCASQICLPNNTCA